MHGPQQRFDDAGLEPAHVEQVPDERVQAIGLVLDRVEELRDVLVAPLDVGLAQARHRRLDRRERRPQVVGHGLQQRGAQLVRLAERRRGCRLRAEAGAFARRGQLRGERVEHLAIVGAEARTDEREDDAVADLLDGVRRVGLGRNGCTVRRFDLPVAVGTGQHRSRVEPERGSERGDEAMERVLAAFVRRRAGPASRLPRGPARASRVRRAARSTSALTTPLTTTKMTSASSVLALRDRPSDGSAG